MATLAEKNMLIGIAKAQIEYVSTSYNEWLAETDPVATRKDKPRDFRNYMIRKCEGNIKEYESL